MLLLTPQKANHLCFWDAIPSPDTADHVSTKFSLAEPQAYRCRSYLKMGCCLGNRQVVFVNHCKATITDGNRNVKCVLFQ